MSTKTDKVEKREPGNVELAQDRPTFVPFTDIYEREDAVLVRCDMPGVEEKDLDITLDNHVLTISGTQRPHTREGFESIWAEYETGVFNRSFRISQDIDRDGIKARIKHGVLDIELPKSKQAQPKKINVEALA